jgi:cyclopropane fatty-acyl-phospholipid synthase-like methyltransferase
MDKMTEKENFEKVYEQPNAVWTRESPPAELAELVDSGELKPCKVLDIGCGEGIYSIYLASKGFEVLGIDFSENAIKIAKQNAEKAGVDIRFEVMDLKDLMELNEKFDFVLEWAILHSIEFDRRLKHIENVKDILNPKGKYLSFCFNEQDPKFGKTGERIRIVSSGERVPIGNKLYFSSMEELKKLFGPYFNILENKILKRVIGSGNSRESVANYFFMEKK